VWSKAAALLLAGYCAAAQPAAAPDRYPSKPIRLIVPYPPGGPTDLIARAVNEPLAQRLGQQVVIDNRGGATTVIGAELAAHSPADGYTLLVATISTLAVNPALQKKLPYDPERDFAAVSMLAAQPYLLVTTVALPVTSVSQLIAYAKANPGKLSFASAGVGAGAHLAAELFKYMARVNIVRVPYKGQGPAVLAVLGGEVQMSFATSSSVSGHIKSGKLRALAIGTVKPSALAPGLPTVAESGLPGYESASNAGMFAPAKTSARLVALLNREIVQALNRPEVRDLLFKDGTEVVGNSPREFAASIQAEMASLGKVIKAAGIRTE